MLKVITSPYWGLVFFCPWQETFWATQYFCKFTRYEMFKIEFNVKKYILVYSKLLCDESFTVVNKEEWKSHN